MTSVPKPLKFLKDHYEPLKKLHSEIPADDAFKVGQISNRHLCRI